METAYRTEDFPADCLTKVVLRRGKLPHIYEAIRRQGITDSVVFPDLDGLAREIKREYAFVIIDCPPSLGILTLNALNAADSALVPLQCEYYAMEGLAHILKTISLVRDRLNPALKVEGIVMTMFDGRTSLAAQVKAEVQRHLGDQILTTVIPRNVRLTEAPSHGKPIMLYDLRSPGSIAYLELTKEVLAHV